MKWWQWVVVAGMMGPLTVMIIVSLVDLNLDHLVALCVGFIVGGMAMVGYLLYARWHRGKEVKNGD